MMSGRDCVWWVEVVVALLLLPLAVACALALSLRLPRLPWMASAWTGWVQGKGATKQTMTSRAASAVAAAWGGVGNTRSPDSGPAGSSSSRLRRRVCAGVSCRVPPSVSTQQSVALCPRWNGIGPRLWRDDPLNLSILISGGKRNQPRFPE